MAEQTPESSEERTGMTGGELGKNILLLPIRILRLPFDLLFLTIDFMRLSFWVLRSLPALFQKLPPRPFSPCFSAGIIDEAGDESTWHCPLAAKYGTKSLLKILFSRLEWCRHGEGRSYLCWVGRRSTPPTSFSRYVVGALFIVLIWAIPLLGLAWMQSGGQPSYAEADAGDSRPDADTTAAYAGQDPAVAELSMEAGRTAAERGDFAAARDHFRQATVQNPGNADAYVGLGQASLNLGLPAAARDAFERAVDLDSAHVDARLGLAAAFHRQGLHEQALQQVREIEAAHDDLPEVFAIKAKALMGKDEIVAAQEAIARALAVAPRDLDVLEAGADIAVRAGNLNDAETRYRRMVDVDPGYVPGRVGLGRVLQLKGQLDQAEGILAMLYTERPDDPRVVDAYVDTLMAARKPSEAIRICRETVAKHPGYLDIRAKLGALALSLGLDNEVYDVAEGLLKEDPGNISAHMQLATLYLRKGLTSAALEHAAKASAQNPNARQVYRLHVRALMANGDLAQAEERLKTLLQSHPADLPALLELSQCQLRQDRTDDALQTLQRAAEIHPASAQVQSQMAQILFSAGRAEDAVQHFRQAVELEPANTVYLNNLAAAINYTDGDLDEALTIALKARQLDPLNPQVADTLAWVHAAREEYDKALPLTAVATAARPAMANFQYHRGAVLAALGQVDEAMLWLRRALSANRPFEGRDEARRLLASLEKQGDETRP